MIEVSTFGLALGIVMLITTLALMYRDILKMHRNNRMLLENQKDIVKRLDYLSNDIKCHETEIRGVKRTVSTYISGNAQ